MANFYFLQIFYFEIGMTFKQTGEAGFLERKGGKNAETKEMGIPYIHVAPRIIRF